MKHINDNEKNIQQLQNVLPDLWGTIGPRFVEASEALAAYFGEAHGLVTFSASAALETVLRGWNISYGDEVIVASWSDPLDALVTAAVGATPVFADICLDTLTLTADGIANCVTAATKAVIADLPAGNPCDAKSLAAFCQEKGIRFILNMGDSWDTTLDGKQIAGYADAAILNMSEQKVIDLGLAGGIVTNNQESFDLFYAYHNCGRPFGDGCTLSFDSIIGGDLRVAEFQASLLVSALPSVKEVVADCRSRQSEIVELVKSGYAPIKTVDGGVSSCAGVLLYPVSDDSTEKTAALEKLAQAGYQASTYYSAMHNQPVWGEGYFKKLTGASVSADNADYPNSMKATSEIIYVSIEKQA